MQSAVVAVVAGDGACDGLLADPVADGGEAAADQGAQLVDVGHAPVLVAVEAQGCAVGHAMGPSELGVAGADLPERPVAGSRQVRSLDVWIRLGSLSAHAVKASRTSDSLAEIMGSPVW